MDKSQVKFGLGQVNNPTPEWANWVFRGYFIISKAFIGYVGGLSAAGVFNIPVKTMLLISLTMSLLLDPVIYGFSKLFGIQPEPVDPEKPLLADKQVDEQGNTNAIPPVIAPVPQAPLVYNSLEDLEKDDPQPPAAVTP